MSGSVLLFPLLCLGLVLTGILIGASVAGAQPEPTRGEEQVLVVRRDWVPLPLWYWLLEWTPRALVLPLLSRLLTRRARPGELSDEASDA